jgi:tRNA pseudouridine55 synthase
VGEATKLAPFFLEADKSYETTILFGVQTDTLDAEGTVVATASVEGAGLDEARLESLLSRFRGDIEQVPPMYSALKRQGRPLYSYARQGQELSREPRRVTIHELTLEAWEPPATARLRLRCSKGTYVRTLAADLGQAAGPGAHVTALRRTRSGPFHLGQALALDALVARIESGASLPFISLPEALVELPAVAVPAELVRTVTDGKRLESRLLDPGPPTPGFRRLLRPDGSLLAVADLGEDSVRLERVFACETFPAGNAPADPAISPTVRLTSTRFL